MGEASVCDSCVLSAQGPLEQADWVSLSAAVIWFWPLLVAVQVLYRESVGTGTPTPVTPEMERVKRSQEICSSVLDQKTSR